jgi:hypothetical protein
MADRLVAFNEADVSLVELLIGLGGDRVSQ